MNCLHIADACMTHSSCVKKTRKFFSVIHLKINFEFGTNKVEYPPFFDILPSRRIDSNIRGIVSRMKNSWIGQRIFSVK